jgi:hypothetical protein
MSNQGIAEAYIQSDLRSPTLSCSDSGRVEGCLRRSLCTRFAHEFTAEDCSEARRARRSSFGCSEWNSPSNKTKQIPHRHESLSHMARHVTGMKLVLFHPDTASRDFPEQRAPRMHDFGTHAAKSTTDRRHISQNSAKS